MTEEELKEQRAEVSVHLMDAMGKLVRAMHGLQVLYLQEPPLISPTVGRALLRGLELSAKAVEVVMVTLTNMACQEAEKETREANPNE